VPNRRGWALGPDLTHLMSRATIAAGAAKNTHDNLRLWIQEPECNQTRLTDARHEAERRGPGCGRELHGDAALERSGKYLCLERDHHFRAQIQDRPWVDELHQCADHGRSQTAGILYILSALLFLAIGGVEALIIRIQLMRSHNDFVSPEVFNRMFTMHGTTMIFSWPCQFCLDLRITGPLMIGARDMAFHA